MEEVKDKIKEESISIKVSENFSVQSDKISQAHFKVVNNLKSGAISQPISQISRFDNSVVMRIFHLKEARMILPSKFEEMHDELKNQLLHKTFDEEKELYLKYLKSRFGYNSHNIKYALPESYQPFLLY